MCVVPCTIVLGNEQERWDSIQVGPEIAKQATNHILSLAFTYLKFVLEQKLMRTFSIFFKTNKKLILIQSPISS
jgi:hypothetical protein